MAADNTTVRLVKRYEDRAGSPLFLSGFFKSPPENFHNSEEIKIDLMRDGEDIAVAIQDLSVGPRTVASTTFTTKEVKPPYFDLETSISAWNMIKRRAGQSPFEDPSFINNAIDESYSSFSKLEAMIRRSVELMSSQVFQTGTVTLKDKTGASMYAIDFSPKATHFPHATITWGEAGAKPLDDIDALARTIRRDGHSVPSVVVMGTTALSEFVQDVTVQKLLNTINYGLGSIAPERIGADGATFIGRIAWGSYAYEIWTYDGSYVDPQTGVVTDYVGADNVIMLSPNARYDLSFGSIPLLGEPDPAAAAFLPPRISLSGRGVDLTTNAWITPDRKRLMVSAGTRPLTIPTAIDTFGCLNTVED